MDALPQHEFDLGLPLKLPTSEDVAPGSGRLHGCFACDESGEASFVPPPSFLRKSALWRIDVLQDLMHDFEIVRRHAIVEWARSLLSTNPEVDQAMRLQAFRHVCDGLGVHVPPNLEALLVLSDRFSSGPQPKA